MTEEPIQEPVDEPQPAAELAPVAAAQPQPVIEAAPQPAAEPTLEPAPVAPIAEETPGEAAVEVTAQTAAEPAATEPTGAVDVEPAPLPAPEGDDLDAAIAQAADLVESDAAPEAATQDAAEGAAGSEQAEPAPAAQFVMPEYDHAASRVSWWPFIVYDVFWLAFAGFMVWQLQQLPADVALFDSDLYPAFLLGGIVLTIAGPLLIFAAWFASWGKPGAHKGHLFISALIKGAIATAVGVTLWWGAILVLDQLRLGAMI